MTKLLKLEEAAQFILAVFLFSRLDYPWWIFPACILLPDLSMLGYLFNTKIGAAIYNLIHHKLPGILVLIVGYGLDVNWIVLTGLILFGHSAMDRIFGYGLKYSDDFKNTHLGRIGR